MVQAVRRRSLTAEAMVRAWVSLCGTCGGHSAIGTVFLRIFLFFPVKIVPPGLSMLIYHLVDEHYDRWWLQFRDSVSPHRHEQQQQRCCYLI
jgi:hypothetical protein